MALRTSIQPFSEVLAAGAVQKLNAYGRFLTITSISGASSILVRLPGQAFVPLQTALSYELPQGSECDHIQIKNDTGSTVTVTLYLSEGPIYQSPGSEIVGTLEDHTTLLTSILAALGGSAYAMAAIGPVAVGTSAVSVVAARASMRKVVLESDPQNTGIIYFGLTSGVTTSSGYFAKLVPGGSVPIETTDKQIYAISDTAGQSVVGFEE